MTVSDILFWRLRSVVVSTGKYTDSRVSESHNTSRRKLGKVPESHLERVHPSLADRQLVLNPGQTYASFCLIAEVEIGTQNK